MGIMRLFCVGALFVPLMLPLFASVEGRVYSSTETLVTDKYAHVIPKYNRVEETERACEEVIDSASELGSNDNRAYSISHDLSFSGGDWDQEPGTTRPLLPFADVVGLKNPAVSIRGSPFKLSSFSITDVNYAHRPKHTVSVNGVLDLVMTSDGPLPETGISEPNTQFQMWRGHTQVSVFFQGVYTESEENGGNRVMCLLGSAMLPARQYDAAHPWSCVYANSWNSTNYQPPMLEP